MVNQNVEQSYDIQSKAAIGFVQHRKNTLTMKLREILEWEEGHPNERRDTEQRHIDADEALLAYINDPEITELYESIERWYA